MPEVTNFAHVPSFDVKASSSPNYEAKSISRNKISTCCPAKRAANLLLQKADVAHKVCMAVGKDCIGNNDGAQQISRILRERSAPDDIDAIFQEVAKFTNFERTDRTMDIYLMEFDVLRKEAEVRMATGSGFPDEYTPLLRMRNAGSPKMRNLRHTLAFPEASTQKRRLFGPRGNAARHDV